MPHRPGRRGLPSGNRQLRRKHALHRGGNPQRLDSDDVEIAAAAKEPELLDLNEALDRFAASDRQKAELVKLRDFVGLTIEESARILGISNPTAKRWWAYARAGLYHEIHET